MTTRRSAGGEFEGYTQTPNIRAKILRDVFAPGDAWYRTGDLMRMDDSGFFYFVDRIGDTFRWKGENVSTAEVARSHRGLSGRYGSQRLRRARARAPRARRHGRGRLDGAFD